ncbi:MAG: DoxX family membrane protein [candidate division NC10 bacterium]|nr:DoxX family membrane protein [candidate division NC10 bacterium]
MSAEPYENPNLGPIWPLALFRIAFGLMYLDMAWQKAPWVITEGHRFGWLYGFIEKEIAHPAIPLYAAFLKQVVLPNFTFFGTLTFLTELGLGVLLLFGILTRLAGLGGFLWQVNIALGGFAVPGEWVWIWPLLTLPQFCFAFCGAGRVLGVDRWLEPALRRQAAASPATWVRLLRYAV